MSKLNSEQTSLSINDQKKLSNRDAKPNLNYIYISSKSPVPFTHLNSVSSNTYSSYDTKLSSNNSKTSNISNDSSLLNNHNNSSYNSSTNTNDDISNYSNLDSRYDSHSKYQSNRPNTYSSNNNRPNSRISLNGQKEFNINKYYDHRYSSYTPISDLSENFVLKNKSTQHHNILLNDANKKLIKIKNLPPISNESNVIMRNKKPTTNEKLIINSINKRHSSHIDNYHSVPIKPVSISENKVEQNNDKNLTYSYYTTTQNSNQKTSDKSSSNKQKDRVYKYNDVSYSILVAPNMNKEKKSKSINNVSMDTFKPSNDSLNESNKNINQKESPLYQKIMNKLSELPDSLLLNNNTKQSSQLSSTPNVNYDSSINNYPKTILNSVTKTPLIPSLNHINQYIEPFTYSSSSAHEVNSKESKPQSKTKENVILIKKPISMKQKYISTLDIVSKDSNEDKRNIKPYDYKINELGLNDINKENRRAKYRSMYVDSLFNNINNYQDNSNSKDNYNNNKERDKINKIKQNESQFKNLYSENSIIPKENNNNNNSYRANEILYSDQTNKINEPVTNLKTVKYASSNDIQDTGRKFIPNSTGGSNSMLERNTFFSDAIDNNSNNFNTFSNNNNNNNNIKQTIDVGLDDISIKSTSYNSDKFKEKSNLNSKISDSINKINVINDQKLRYSKLVDSEKVEKNEESANVSSLHSSHSDYKNVDVTKEIIKPLNKNTQEDQICLNEKSKPENHIDNATEIVRNKENIRKTRDYIQIIKKAQNTNEQIGEKSEQKDNSNKKKLNFKKQTTENKIIFNEKYLKNLNSKNENEFNTKHTINIKNRTNSDLNIKKPSGQDIEEIEQATVFESSNETTSFTDDSSDVDSDLNLDEPIVKLDLNNLRGKAKQLKKLNFIPIPDKSKMAKIIVNYTPQARTSRLQTPNSLSDPKSFEQQKSTFDSNNETSRKIEYLANEINKIRARSKSKDHDAEVSQINEKLNNRYDIREPIPVRIGCNLRKISTPPPLPHLVNSRSKRNSIHESENIERITKNSSTSNKSFTERDSQPITITTAIREGRLEKPMRFNNGLPPPPPPQQSPSNSQASSQPISRQVMNQTPIKNVLSNEILKSNLSSNNSCNNNNNEVRLRKLVTPTAMSNNQELFNFKLHNNTNKTNKADSAETNNINISNNNSDNRKNENKKLEQKDKSLFADLQKKLQNPEVKSQPKDIIIKNSKKEDKYNISTNLPQLDKIDYVLKTSDDKLLTNIIPFQDDKKTSNCKTKSNRLGIPINIDNNYDDPWLSKDFKNGKNFYENYSRENDRRKKEGDGFLMLLPGIAIPIDTDAGDSDDSS